MHKKKDILELLQELGSIRLSDSERAALRQRLEQHTGSLPIISPVTKSDLDRLDMQKGNIPSPISRYSLMRSKKHMTGIVVALILAVSGGGTVAAAERANPGDVLYPIKTEVNETVRGWAAVSLESEARLDARLAERRMREAAELSSRGELDSETRVQLAQRARAHEENMSERIAALRAKGKVEAAASLEVALHTTLQVHEQVFGSVVENAELDVETRTEIDNALLELDASVGATLDTTLRALERAIDTATTSIRTEFNARTGASTTATTSRDTQNSIEVRTNVDLDATSTGGGNTGASGNGSLETDVDANVDVSSTGVQIESNNSIRGNGGVNLSL